MENQKLKKVRQIMGLTQQEMANKLQIDKVNYNRLERGKSEMSGRTFYKLLKLLTEYNIIQIKKIKDF